MKQNKKYVELRVIVDKKNIYKVAYPEFRIPDNLTKDDFIDVISYSLRNMQDIAIQAGLRRE